MPYDELIEFPDGTRAFVRLGGRRPRPKPCKCGAISTLQCDYPTLAGTCDAYLCRQCAVRVGPNRDYCRTHPEDTNQ